MRYFLSPSGVKVQQSLLEDHADVGRRILKDKGITPKDYTDIYDQMFKLGFCRVVEFPDHVCAENPFMDLNRAQREFLEDRKSDAEVPRKLSVNNKLFTETRRGGSLTIEELAEKLLG